MHLRRYLTTIKRWSWLIILSTVVAGGVSYYVTSQQPRLYQASTKMLVGTAFFDPNPTGSQLTTSQLLARTYAQILRTQPVLQGTIDALGLPMTPDGLRARVNSRVIEFTQIMEISVIDTDPQRAQEIANEISHQLTLQGPAAAEREQAEMRSFVQSQSLELQRSIEKAQARLAEVSDSLLTTTSARELEAKKQEIAELQAQIGEWQRQYTDLVQFLSPNAINYLTVLEAADVPRAPFAPNDMLNTLLAALVGFLVSTTAVVLLEYFDDTIKGKEEIQSLLGLPTLGHIAVYKGVKGDRLAPAAEPRSSVAEAYRVLRTNIQFSSVDKPIKTVVVTSASPKEGKSITSANLAAVMAQAGLRTALVDCDLRRPTIHTILGLPNEYGLSNCLLAHSAPDNFMRQARVENLRVLTTGPLPPNPAELLGSKSMAQLAAKLASDYDIVIFDSPPVMPVADTPVLSRLCDGTILVVSSGSSRRDAVVRAKEILEQAGVRVLGVVLNRVNQRTSGYGEYYRYYSSERKPHKAGPTPKQPSGVEQTSNN